MGQRQSTADGSDTPRPEDAKKDYYELLGVERTATEDEIKKAYRKKALELHPDRNYGNVDWATKLFSEVQSAYEVLSDPQERAWYDSHRDVLLRGDGAAGGGPDGEEYSYNVRLTTTDEVLKLMMKFNGRMDYSDAPSGFYGGLQGFFKQLAKEEDIACQWEDQDPLDYPDFGSKDDDYEDVVRPFYAAWTGFATRKSYAWKDQYRLSDAPDRRIRRLMEKENKKLREEAAQEFNDAVRSLVAFVRKRDPRVKNNQKSEAERQKALKEAAAAQAARSRAERQAKLEELEGYAIPDWAQSRTQKDENEGTFSSESEVEEHQYDCVVCDKTFKSEAQFHAHEKSKKHIKLLKQLKREMKEEGKELDLDEEAPASNVVELVDEEGAVEDEAPLAGATEESDNEELTSKKQAAVSDDEMSDEDAGTQIHKSPKTEQKTATTQLPHPQPSGSESESEADEDDDYAPRSKIESRLTFSTNTTNITNTVEDPINLNPLRIDESNIDDRSKPYAISDSESSRVQGSGQSTPKPGKAKQKRARKAAVTNGSKDNKATGGSGGGDGGAGAGETTCAVCSASFASKTKLFAHIKEEDHAAPISQIKGSGNGGKKKKGKR